MRFTYCLTAIICASRLVSTKRIVANEQQMEAGEKERQDTQPIVTTVVGAADKKSVEAADYVFVHDGHCGEAGQHYDSITGRLEYQGSIQACSNACNRRGRSQCGSFAFNSDTHDCVLYNKRIWINSQDPQDRGCPDGKWHKAPGYNFYGITQADPIWQKRPGTYCAKNWDSDWAARTVVPLAECLASCLASPWCVAITVGTSAGVENNCAMCTKPYWSEPWESSAWATTYSKKPCVARKLFTNMNSWYEDRDARESDCDWQCKSSGLYEWCTRSVFTFDKDGKDNGKCELYDCDHTVPRGV